MRPCARLARAGVRAGAACGRTCRARARSSFDSTLYKPSNSSNAALSSPKMPQHTSARDSDASALLEAFPGKGVLDWPCTGLYTDIMVHKGETPDESAAWFRALAATEADEFWTAYARKVEAGLERRRWMNVLSLLRQRGQRR